MKDERWIERKSAIRNGRGTLIKHILKRDKNCKNS